MQTPNKNVEDFTNVELKAIGFDLVKDIEKLHNNLKVVNDELEKRLNTPKNISPEATESPTTEVNS